jgi:hypothetical protein
VKKNYRIFIYSLLLIGVFNWVSIVEFKYGIPQFVKYLLSVFAFGEIIYYRISNPLKPEPGQMFKPIIWFFVGWSAILIISSILKLDGIFYIQRVFGQRYFFLPYLLPILIIYSRFGIDFFSKYFQYSYFLIIPAIIIQLMVLLSRSFDNWHENFYLIWIFDIGSSFLLLTSHFSKRKYLSTAAILYVFLMLILAMLCGRRGLSIEYALLFLFMAIIRLQSSFVSMGNRMRVYASGLAMVIVLLAFGSIFQSTMIFQRGFSREAFEESRGHVFEDFMEDFRGSSDWTRGRGLDGTVLRTINVDTGTESLIENGYLTIILKGGLIYLLPFVIILLRAVFLGFFNSNNDLSKALAALLFIHLIIMFQFNLPDYSSNYILVWIAVSTCFNREMREIGNEEVSKAINV